MRADIASLQSLITRIDRLIYSGKSVSDADLAAMQKEVADMKSRYSSLSSPWARY
jgi:hypothetical protein